MEQEGYSLLSTAWFGNTTLQLLVFLAIILLSATLKQVLARLVSRLSFRLLRKTYAQNFVADFKKLLEPPLERLILLVFVYVAFSFLTWPLFFLNHSIAGVSLALALQHLYGMYFILVFSWLLFRIIDFTVLAWAANPKIKDSRLRSQFLPFMTELAKIFLGILIGFFIMGTVFKVNVANIIAGLGIGGLAVALAAKETLENLFASFTIFLDKPFAVGDFVKVGGISGTVEQVGFRSTRLRTVDKSYLTIPNKLMTDQALDNVSMRTFTRVDKQFILQTGTHPDAVKSINTAVALFIEGHNLTTGEVQVRFTNFFEGGGLQVQLYYFVASLAQQEVLTVTEEVNLAIATIVYNHGSGFFVNPK